mgnify:CR=1 FL=1
MADPNIAIEKTLGVEGFDSNHPADPGGRTRWGLTERSFPEVFVNGPPTLDTAKEIYRIYFWNKLHLTELFSQVIANEVFDTAVNMGTGVAAQYLQGAYNALRIEGSPALVPDGRIGVKTIDAVNFFTSHSKGYETALRNVLDNYQGQNYLRINNAAFMRGWFANRIDNA